MFRIDEYNILFFSELDPLRGRAGASAWLFAEGERFHKVHDAFQSPDSRGRPVVSTAGCSGAVYILRHPEDVAVSLSHCFSWPLERCVDYLLDPNAALGQGSTSVVLRCGSTWAAGISMCAPGLIKLNCQS